MRKGCHPQTITNKFCYGVCHSFYIPKDREVTKVQDACVPTDTVKQQVTLTCLKKKKKSAKGRKKRRSGWRKKVVTVEKVLNCGCSRIWCSSTLAVQWSDSYSTVVVPGFDPSFLYSWNVRKRTRSVGFTRQKFIIPMLFQLYTTLSSTYRQQIHLDLNLNERNMINGKYKLFKLWINYD